MHTFERLRTIPFLTGLDTEHLHILAASLNAQQFERGDLIFHQGSIGSVLYIVLSGQVRIFTVSEAGQEISVTIFRSGDFFGELALLDGQPRSASAVAMCGTSTLLLHRTAFLEAVRAHPPIAVAVLEAMAKRLRQSTSHTDLLATGSAMRRVAAQILMLAERYGSSEAGVTQIDLRLTQDDLASLAGTTRETTNRALAVLRERGLIRIQRSLLWVLDMPRLESLIQELT